MSKKTQGLIDIFKSKIIQIHLNKKFDDIGDSFKFYIKKRIKKIMDKPIYTDCLKYIRESVVYDINNILTPPKPKKTFFESYSDMCNYRAENPDNEDLFKVNNF
jgi:hypothetical protein